MVVTAATAADGATAVHVDAHSDEGPALLLRIDKATRLFEEQIAGIINELQGV